MLKNKKISKQLSLNTLDFIKKKFSINSSQEFKLNKFLEKLINYNKHTNLVGKSTLTNPWRSHILDSIQISRHMNKKNSNILDMGTGAGFPGLVLAIIGYNNVTLVDSNMKKIYFIKTVCSELNIKVKIVLSRIEKLKKEKYKFLTSRALANLNKLFIYSHKFTNKDTVQIFLKGKTFNNEIKEAKKKWSFNNEIHQSYSDIRGRVIIIKNLKLIK